ncbi:hypothetical protein A9Q74_11520 [Colwellia sp. 39_35_sub15_T18]|nr:hypothetical protein A9Q74_11520 [Colwellia sp. 39_35_sub15_T18]
MASIKIIFIAVILLLSSTTTSQSLRVVTEDLPPLQILQKNGQITGVMVEVVETLLKKAAIDGKVEIFPWARSYQIAKEHKNTLIFSMFRDESREQKFQWLGKLLTINSYLVALKSNNDFNINTIEDAKKYSVGSVREDLAEHYLEKHGFVENKNLYLSSDYKVLWHMLYSGRTDLAFTNDILWRHELEGTGLDPSKIQFVYQIPNFAADLYLAASLDIDKVTIERLKSALAQMKANGEYQTILRKWHIKPNSTH